MKFEHYYAISAQFQGHKLKPNILKTCASSLSLHEQRFCKSTIPKEAPYQIKVRFSKYNNRYAILYMPN